MAKDESFDVVSEFDPQELANALDQARRDVTTRYDLKQSNTTMECSDNKLITINTSDEYALESVVEIMITKAVKRGLSPMIFDRQKVETAANSRIRQVINLKEGIDKEIAKKVVAEIKSLKLKVQGSIQGEQVRVSGKNRDDLQAVIAHLKEQSESWDLPLQFENFR